MKIQSVMNLSHLETNISKKKNHFSILISMKHKSNNKGLYFCQRFKYITDHCKCSSVGNCRAASRKFKTHTCIYSLFLKYLIV
jgi:hypothetical protein